MCEAIEQRAVRKVKKTEKRGEKMGKKKNEKSASAVNGQPSLRDKMLIRVRLKNVPAIGELRDAACIQPNVAIKLDPAAPGKWVIKGGLIDFVASNQTIGQSAKYLFSITNICLVKVTMYL